MLHIAHHVSLEKKTLAMEVMAYFNKETLAVRTY
jgi:hypothetical protein